jgi:hypothetical protein
MRAASGGGTATTTCCAVTVTASEVTTTPPSVCAMPRTGVPSRTLDPRAAATRSEITCDPPTMRLCCAPLRTLNNRSNVPGCVSSPAPAT